MLKPHRVHSSRILRDQNRQSRGVGFARFLLVYNSLIVRMTDREAADAVIEQWNGKFYPGHDSIALQVRFADTPMQKSTPSCFARLHLRTQKCYSTPPQLACQRV